MSNQSKKAIAFWNKYNRLVDEAYRLFDVANKTDDRRQARAIRNHAHDLLVQADAMFN
ncbi:MAG: hypothetical protein IJ087_18525 [Eggerthellaceae bacterium]|nr:hypothetical protein [Eggerthellaceae bacterium]